MSDTRKVKTAKVFLVGDAGVGKTQLISKYVDNRFNLYSRSTVGLDFTSKEVIGAQGTKVTFQIWDTAGEELISKRKLNINTGIYQGAAAFVIVFDLTNRESFEDIKARFIDVIQSQKFDPAPQIILVGNKSDMSEEKRVVSDAEGEALAQSLGYQYIRASAQTGEGIDAVFESIAEHQVVNAIENPSLSNGKTSRRDAAPPPPPNFFQSHWRAMLVGALIVGGIVAIGVFTGGIGFAVAGGAVAGAVVVGAIGGGLIDMSWDNKKNREDAKNRQGMVRDDSDKKGKDAYIDAQLQLINEVLSQPTTPALTSTTSTTTPTSVPKTPAAPSTSAPTSTTSTTTPTIPTTSIPKRHN